MQFQNILFWLSFAFNLHLSELVLFLNGSDKILSMKNITLLIIGLLFLNVQYSLAQNKVETKIVEAIQKGDAKTICQQFDSKVELGVLQNKNYFSREQAELILKKFFKENPPKAFTIQHQGGKENNLFFIGIYESGTAKYRIYFHLREKENKIIIPLFKIEANK